MVAIVRQNGSAQSVLLLAVVFMQFALQLRALALSPIPAHSRTVWPTSEVEYTLGEESRMKVEGMRVESRKTRGWLNALDQPMHANAHLTDLQALSFTTPEPVDLSALRLSN
ncbi:hypothetical protein V1478_005463 [Vespula squamosa]|uniref:Secreted protein n=1 Tax=Vespula squamosa TaxID=30214 RepID=A0ABD2BED4_VESSQ